MGQAARRQLAEDETIVEISTDKVDAEVPAPAAGTLTEILADAGDTVTVGQVIARMTSGNGAAPAKAARSARADRAPRPAGDAETDPTPDGLKVTPVARASPPRRASISQGQGHRPDGRIGKADVLAYERTAPRRHRRPRRRPPASRPCSKGASAMLARYMDESRQIPTATSFRTITVTTLDARRKQLKAAGHRSPSRT